MSSGEQLLGQVGDDGSVEGEREGVGFGSGESGSVAGREEREVKDEVGRGRERVKAGLEGVRARQDEIGLGGRRKEGGRTRVEGQFGEEGKDERLKSQENPTHDPA